MASRRASKSVKLLKTLNYKTLVLNDVLCPICRSILLEPVTLPCNHGFCLSCFEGTMQNANLVCPLCRIRIGSWLRKAKKEGTLVNKEFWKVIKEKYPQHVRNKLSGIDEDLEEEPRIIVARPGELRQEYEKEKKKEEEEFRIKHEEAIRASEELIMKIKEEEEYEQAVREEKLKFDEQVAKKLAQELATTSSSTTQIKHTNKRQVSIDKFIKQENESSTSQNIQMKPISNFATKEYTCRVLCLDNKKGSNSDSRKKGVSPFIKKKIQQIQKIVDNEINSDGSDCIESELRYFKPIDHKLYPRSIGKPAIKIPTKKAHLNGTAKLSSPTGAINFHSNFLESAFARISSYTINNDTKVASSTASSSKLKRRLSEEEACGNYNKRNSKKRKEMETNERDSPVLNNFANSSRTKRQLFGKFNSISLQTENSLSPPFYGFKNADAISDKVVITNNIMKNGLIDIIDEEQKMLQEKADMEFAKKLQDELNKVHNTRSSRRSSGNTKRQATLDEIMINPYRVK